MAGNSDLAKKIKKIYPSVTNDDFAAGAGIICLQNNLDGKGDYIAEWKHPSLSKPTDMQIEDA